MGGPGFSATGRGECQALIGVIDSFGEFSDHGPYERAIITVHVAENVAVES